MLRRPHSVTAVAALYVLSGLVGVVYHATELDLRDPFASAEPWVLAIRLLAIVAGVFLLRGADWARWLALAWMALHVVLGAMHAWTQAVAHLVLLAAIAYALLRPPASAYFRGASPPPEPPPAV